MATSGGASAVFIDLDRTLLAHASGQVLNRALVEEGVLPEGRSLPGDRLLYAVNNRFGENLLSMSLVRAAARVARGWRQDQVQAAGRRAISALSELVAPFAPQRLAAFRAEGLRLVLTTTTPVDMIAPFAEAYGFDDLIATAYETREGRYTGRLYEGFVWGTGKLRAVREWSDANDVDLGDCHACSDSIFDVPLLSSVGTPHAVNPDPSLTVVATSAVLAGRALGPPSGRPERHRIRAVPPDSALRAQAVLSVCTFRHRGDGERARTRACPTGRQSPELFRRGRTRPRRTRDRAAGSLLGQEGDLRCARRRHDRSCHRRHRRRPGQRRRPIAARRRGRIEGGGGGHRAAAGDDPAWLRLLRPGAARQDRDGAPRGVDRGHRRPRRAVGHREGVAEVGKSPRRHSGAQTAGRVGPRRQAGRALAHGCQGGHRDDHAGHRARCCHPSRVERHEPTAEELARTKPPR